MPRLFPSYQTEISTIQSYQERQRQVDSIVQSVTPEAASIISEYGRQSPTISPGVIRSLAQAGIRPEHPVAQFAITQAQYRNLSTRGSWHGDTTRRRRAPQNPVTPAQLREQLNPQQTLDDAMSAAEEAGLIQDGVLVEPTPPVEGGHFAEEAEDTYQIFERVKNAFRTANLDLPYVRQASINGQINAVPVSLSPSGQENPLGSPLPVDLPGAGSQGGHVLSGFGELLEDLGVPKLLEAAEVSNPAQEATQQAGVTVNAADPFAPAAPYIRAGLMGLDAPIQEAQGQVRNIYAATHGYSPDWFEPQSDLGIALGGNFGFQDAGSGYLVDPESAIARERRTRESERGQIAGHNITLGRWVADSVTTPDTTPFRIMSGLVDGAAQVIDPSALVLGKVGDIATARRLFQPTEVDAGMFRGLRNVLHGPTAERFLDNNIALINRLRAETDPYTIARLTNFKIDPQMARSLASVNDTRDVRAIITSAVERGRIRSTTDLTGTYTTRVQHSWSDTRRALNPDYKPRSWRWTAQVPLSTMDLDNPRQVADNLRRTLRNAKAPEEDIRAVYNQVANSTTRTQVFNSVMDAQDSVGNMLRHYGIQDEETISSLININRETYNEHLSGLVDEIGRDVPTWNHLTADGESIEVAGPFLPSEHLSRTVHIPNIREVRRLTTRYSFLTSKGGTKGFGQQRLPLAFMDGVTSRVMKPLWLMRLAWPIRVVGEEQIRMATAGLDSAFSGHPLSWLSLVIGSKQNRLGKLLDTITPGLKTQSTHTLSGLLFDELDDFQSAVYNTHRAWLDNNGAIPIATPTLYNREIPEEVADFRHAWSSQINDLFHDPVSNFVSNNTLDDAVTWLWKGEGKKWRQQLQDAHGSQNLATREATQVYVEQVSDLIHRMAGGDTDVLHAIKTGTYNQSGTLSSVTKGATSELNPSFTRWLDSHLSSAPTRIKGPRWRRQDLRSELGQGWDQALDTFYGAMMGVPTGTLSRAPAFKQFYWKRAAELIPYADEATQSIILTNAIKSNIPKRTLRHLERQASTRTGKLTLNEVEDLTKGYALDDTKTLLYDISEKGQASDVLRNVVPFAEAWREVLTRWGSLTIKKAGKPIRRAQQIIQGGRGEEFGEVMGAPEDKGFFYKNPDGEEVFAYPGSQWLMSQETNIPGSPINLPGIPVPLTGRVQGLNMFGSIFPSLGPVAQIPVAFFLQDKPQLEWWRQQLLPFGGPGAEDAASISDLKEYMPTYMHTAFDLFFEGGQDDRVYNSTVMYTASYLYSTGEYGSSVDEQQRLMEDARRKASDIYAVRALGQFTLPSAPSPTWMVKDQDGRLLAQRILSQEFYAEILPESPGYQEATEQFLELYGTEAIGAIIPHSNAIIPNVPVSLEAAQWAAENSNVVSQFPLTYALFAPEGDFHIQTFMKSFYNDERQPLTPEQWQALRDNTLANYWYESERRRLGPGADTPTDPQARWLRERRTAIQESFPYWGDRTGQGESPSVDVLIRDLERASTNPTLANTNAGRALTFYLQLRAQAIQQSEQWSDTGNPTSFRSSQALSGTRTWLRSEAARLLESYPEFQAMWDYVFDRELQAED